MTDTDKLRAQLLIDVTFDKVGTNPEAILKSLHALAQFYLKRCEAIADTGAKIDGYHYEVNELTPSSEKTAMQMSPVGVNECSCDDYVCPGWGVFYRDVDGVYDIQRCDTCKRFESDTEAYNYVRALEGLDLVRHMVAYKEKLREQLSGARRRAVEPFIELLEHIEHMLGKVEKPNDESNPDGE